MAKARKFVAYRRLERPYTRISKFKKKSYVRSRPHSNIVRYDMGNATKKFEFQLDLCSKDVLQIRHNAIESARQTTNKMLESKIGGTDYFFKIRIYPHHILRENPLASGAGADRMSTGMQASFGKAIGSAARITKKGQVLFSVYTNKSQLDIAKKALKRASYKIPCSTLIKIKNLEENKNAKKYIKN